MPGYSLGGALYFVTFIDDYSIYSTVYLLKRKSDMITCFQAYKALVENQTSHKVKIICTDNGTEYTSHALKKICTDSGILHQLIATYTSQQNDVAKRKNRTLVESAQCMLHCFKWLPSPLFFGMKPLRRQITYKIA